MIAIDHPTRRTCLLLGIAALSTAFVGEANADGVTSVPVPPGEVPPRPLPGPYHSPMPTIDPVKIRREKRRRKRRARMRRKSGPLVPGSPPVNAGPPPASAGPPPR